ncbi:hypothetical protein [Hymenobacter algoricola]|uniref:Uncharacterized protein n=1 Tax=Hymenobacter algoricola TaxID=486267 RepID=A0ABP7MDS1_9BACT
MLDLNAPILPGHSAAGIRLGQPVAEVLRYAPAPVIETLSTVTVYRFGAVAVWARDGMVDQVGVFDGYTGSLPSGVCLGMPLVEVQRRMGPVVEEWDDTLMVEGSDGWCFDTGAWANGWEVEQNLEARLVEIFVCTSKQGE